MFQSIDQSIHHEPLLPLYHTISTPAFPEHLVQIPHQRLGPLVRRKVAPVRMLLLKHDGPQGPAPRFRRNAEIPGEVGEAEFDVWHVPAQLGAVLVRGVVHFVVDPEAGGGAGGGEEVETDPGQDLVRRPGVGVCPVVEFLVDPGEQGDGAVA